MVERRNSAESMNSMIGRELAEIEGDGDSHVLKPSELTKGRKRKNIPTREESSTNDSMEGDDEFTQLQPKPGAHMVLPFIPPKVAFQDIWYWWYLSDFDHLAVPNDEEGGGQLDQAERVSEKLDKSWSVTSKVCFCIAFSTYKYLYFQLVCQRTNNPM